MSKHSHYNSNDGLLSIEVLPGKGRGYIASKDIPAGTVLHTAEPLATAVSQEWIPETCMWCFDFSYPKKQKVKIVDDGEELQALFEEWAQNLGQARNRRCQSNKKKHSTKLYKDMVFCSDACRQKYKLKGHMNNGALQEWKLALAVNLRLDEELRNTTKIEPNLSFTAAQSSTAILEETKESIEKWIDANDDDQLLDWLDMAWSCLTRDFRLYKEIDDADITMCRLITSCIIQKQIEEEASNDQLQNMPLSFRDIFAIQDNEVTYFRSCFDESLDRLPALPHLDNASRKLLLMSLVPMEIKEVMALYCFYQRALSKSSLQNIPSLSDVSHQLFRTIYFRERANSFGLWEHSVSGSNINNGDVTEDLELLGWGIYPSAVYFNHSCDANVKKIRDGRRIKFIACRSIEQGEEACISYGSVEKGVNERRSRLLEHYHFYCQCARCIHETALKPQHGAR